MARVPRVRIKRIYEAPSPRDGSRILVDRLWPRGVRKADAAIDLWLKDVAPSGPLRRWFGHEPGRWDEFRRRYYGELRQHPDGIRHLRDLARSQAVTLVYSAHDEEHNQARALADFLNDADVPQGSRHRAGAAT